MDLLSGKLNAYFVGKCVAKLDGAADAVLTAKSTIDATLTDDYATADYLVIELNGMYDRLRQIEEAVGDWKFKSHE